MKLRYSFLLILFVLIIDQWSKIYVKTHFSLGESVDVFSWFYIYFWENEGAAWGAKIPGEYGKLILTWFRIFAVVFFGYWLYVSTRQKKPTIFLISISLILAGALGNIIDSVLYGVLFNDSTNQVATLLSDQPYGTLFHGKVVDMLYFPLIEYPVPSWVPVWGGSVFRFFEPVFNIADSSISIAVGLLIVFHKKAFPSKQES